MTGRNRELFPKSSNQAPIVYKGEDVERVKYCERKPNTVFLLRVLDIV